MIESVGRCCPDGTYWDAGVEKCLDFNIVVEIDPEDDQNDSEIDYTKCKINENGLCTEC